VHLDIENNIKKRKIPNKIIESVEFHYFVFLTHNIKIFALKNLKIMLMIVWLQTDNLVNLISSKRT